MRTISACLLAVVLVSVSAIAWAGAQQARPVSSGAPTVDEMLTAFRADMQSTRADLLAKNLTLSAEQAAKFWPLFEQYQKEQNVVMDEQLRGIQAYVEDYQTIDDATSLTLINAHLARDAKMNELRQRWLGEFQKVLPTRTAVRAIQIDRRLSLLAQLELTTRIPLVH